jgi:DHA3 family macrolide efflux protein-like MFS transporter
VLTNRYVRTIVLSRVLLQLGVWVRNFAILLYVTDATNNDPYSVSPISVAEFAPIFVFAIIGGLFADRWKPKLTMITSDWLSSASIFIVLAVLSYGSWHELLFATLISSILSQFSQPSAMKLFKQNVPEAQIQGLMAMYQSLMAFFIVIGPVVGAFVYSQYGIHASLIVTGCLFVGSGLILTSLPRDSQSLMDKSPLSITSELKAGLRYVFSNRLLLTLGATFAVSGLALGLLQPLMIFVVIDNLGQDRSFLQWMIMTNGAAMLVGGAFIMGIARKVSPQALLAMGLIVSTIGTMGIGGSTYIPLTLGFQIHVGIQTLIMKNTEAAFIGRVGGVLTPMFMGMMVVGMSAAGFLKEASSLWIVYGTAGTLFMLGALLVGSTIRKKQVALQ